MKLRFVVFTKKKTMEYNSKHKQINIKQVTFYLLVIFTMIQF